METGGYGAPRPQKVLAGVNMNTVPLLSAEEIDALTEEQMQLFDTFRPVPEMHDGVETLPRDFNAEFLRFPASWAQERMWFIDQVQGGSWGYQVPIALRLRGRLNRCALGRALQLLVRRHETLRTVFSSEDGVLAQVISGRSDFALVTVDLGKLEPAEREQEVRRHMSEEAHGNFDLSSGPLIRGRLIILAGEEHVLLITIHHIVVDGWSKGIVLRELGELYTSCVEERSDAMQPLLVQYADFAQWQRHEWERSRLVREKLEYWKKRLGGVSGSLGLPCRRSGSGAHSHRGGRVSVELGEQLSANIKSLARKRSVTPFMVMLTCLGIVLSRLTGREDIIVGSPIASRRRVEFEGIVGLFVNPLVLRMSINDEATIEQLLRQVMDVTVGAYENQEVPYEKVVQAVRPERSDGENSLYEVSFVLHNEPRHEPRMSGLMVSTEEEVDEPAMVDLLLALEEKDRNFVGSAYFAAEVFDRETISRWMEYFVAVLRGAVDDDEARVGDVPMLEGNEIERVISRPNMTEVPYRSDATVHELFEERAANVPERVAIEDGARTLTYDQVNRRANQLANFLVSEGVRPDQVVGLFLRRGCEMVIGLLAILKAGGAYLPLDPDYPEDRLRHMVEDSAPQIVLTSKELSGSFPPGTKMIPLDGEMTDLAGFIDANLPAARLGVTSANLAYVIYTSGSTGRPKGTAMRHRSLVNLIEWHRRIFGAAGVCRVLQYAALSFDVAFQEIFSTLCAGGTLVMLDEWTRKDVKALAEFLVDHLIQRLFVPPVMLQGLAEFHMHRPLEPLCLRDVITAGEQLKISPEIREFFRRLEGCRLHNHYGPTETHVVTSVTLEGNPGNWADLPSIGRPIDNTRIYVLDGHMRAVPIGVAGEIYIGGANVARGYLNRPTLTAQRFVVDPYSTDSHARLYKTGDLGRWTPDGMLEYLGRNDDQVKIRGFRIELGEIEALLLSHESVRHAVVVAREDVPGDKRLVAYIVPREDPAPTAEGLRVHLKQALPEYMVPGAYVTLHELPLTPSGKVDRRSLPKPQAGVFARTYEAPQGEVEEIVARIWLNLLGTERVGRNENFFELGGHSLLGMKLIAAIDQSFGVRLSPAIIFKCPTIREFSMAIVERKQSCSCQVNSPEQHEEWRI